LISLTQQFSQSDLAVKFKRWSFIKESSDFVELMNEEREVCSSKEEFNVSLHIEKNAGSSYRNSRWGWL